MPFDLQELPQALQVTTSLFLFDHLSLYIMVYSLSLSLSLLVWLGSSTTMGASSTLFKRISLPKLVILLVLDLAVIPSTSKHQLGFFLFPHFLNTSVNFILNHLVHFPRFLYGEQARFFRDEIHLDLKHSKTGTVSMASAGENLNASQVSPYSFFL